MSQCVTTPTATNTGVRTEQVVVTTTTTKVTTGNPTTTTLFETTTSCAEPVGSAAPVCVPVTSSSVSVIAGGVRTDQVPVTLTSNTVVSNPTTLFGTSCSSTTTKNDNANTSPGNTGGSGSTTPTTLTTAVPVTDASGNVSMSSLTVISTPPPATVTGDNGANGTVGTNPGHKSTNVGAIVGGTIGGIIALVALLVLAWFLLKSRRRWDSAFDNDYQSFMGRKKHTLDLDAEYDEPVGPSPEPKPYHYGLVGGSIPSPSGHSPSDSPFNTLRSASALSGHGRQDSLTPLSAHERNLSFGSHSPNPSISQPPMMQAASDDYFPNIPPPPPLSPPLGNRSTPSPQPRTSYPPSQRPPSYGSPIPDPFAAASPTMLPPGAAPPRGQQRPSSPASPVSPRVSTSSPPPSSTPRGHTPQRGSVATSSVRSSINDYPMRGGGVLRVANGDIPKSPMTPNIPDTNTSARPASRFKSPLSLDLSDSGFDADELLGSLSSGRRTSRQT